MTPEEKVLLFACDFVVATIEEHLSQPSATIEPVAYHLFDFNVENNSKGSSRFYVKDPGEDGAIYGFRDAQGDLMVGFEADGKTVHETEPGPLLEEQLSRFI